MRKLLLATVAALGASMGVASYADAQVVDDTNGQNFPTPGTVTVRLNGRYRFYAGVNSDSGLRTDTLPTVSAASSGAPVPADQGSNRLANYGFLSYARLYPGFDGVAANGLKYGASLEIRQDGSYGAGGGTYGSISGADRSRNGLYFRRAFGYVGTDKVGTFRFGNADGPLTLFLTGSGESFNDGAWNGDAPAFLPGNLQLVFPFPDVGNLYSTTKAVYLSPQFYGVDFGVSFEPSTANGSSNGCSGASLQENTANVILPGNGVASQGCDALASTSTGDYSRRRNTFEGVIRYRGTFGPVGIAATAGGVKSGRILDSASPQRAQQYNDLAVADFGLSVTYIGINVFGNYQVGQQGVQWALSPKNTNGTATENASAYTAGIQYTFGPIVVGASYIDSGTPGNQGANNLANGGHQRREQGIAAGGTYSLAPGISLFLSYLYDQRKQIGYNFVNGTTQAVGATTPDAFNHNKVNGQVLSIGTSFAW